MSRYRFLSFVSAFLAGLIAVEAVAEPLAQSALWSDRITALHRNLNSASPMATPASFAEASLTMLRLVEVRGPADAPARVRIIQDVHRNAEAQRLISASLDLLASRNEAGLVAVEGAWTPIDLSPFHGEGLNAILAPMVRQMLADNRLSGAAQAAVSNDRLPLLVGIDDAALHAANADAYRRFLPQRKVADAAIAEQFVRDGRASSRWPRELQGRLAAAHAFRLGTLALGAYAKTFSGAVGPALARYQAALAAESNLDIAAVRRERMVLVSVLSRRLSPSEMEKLLADSMSLRVGRISDARYHENLLTLAASNGVQASAFPAMQSYVRYANLSDGVDAVAFMRELTTAEEEEIRGAAEDPAQAEAALMLRDHGLLPKLASFSLTPEEWTRLDGRWSALDASMTGSLSEAAAFYRCSQARDRAMSDRLLSEIRSRGAVSTAVIAGGFHTPGMIERLAAAGLRVEVYRPRLTAAPSDGSAYLTEFARVRTPLERIVEGDRLFLAAPPFSAAARFEVANRGAAWLYAKARWPFASLSSWLSRACGWELVEAKTEGETAVLRQRRYTDREVELQVIVPIEKTSDPVTITPLRGPWRFRSVLMFALVPTLFSTFSPILIPLSLRAIVDFLPAGMLITSVVKLFALFVSVGLMAVIIAVPTAAVIHTFVVYGGMMVVRYLDRFRPASSIRAALERRVAREIEIVRRAARRDDVLGEALALVDAVGFTNDQDAVAQGGKVIRKTDGGVERILVVLTAMRFTRSVFRYLLIRRAIGFYFDKKVTDLGGDVDPTFVAAKRLFWEIYANFVLLRHSRVIPSTVPYTLLHLLTWGTAAVAGALALLVLAALRDGRAGVRQTIAVWRTLFSALVFRDRDVRWTPGPLRPFLRRPFEALTAVFLFLGGAATVVATIVVVGLPDEALGVITFVAAALMLNLMTVVSFGRLIQENSNAYRHRRKDDPPPPGGPPTAGPDGDTPPAPGSPEALGRDIASAADAISQRLDVSAPMDRVIGNVVVENLGRDLTTAPGSRPAFTPAEMDRVLDAIRKYRRKPLTPRAAALLIRAVSPEAAPSAEAGSKIFRFLLRADNVDDFVAWLRRAPESRRVAVIADPDARERLDALPVDLRGRFTTTYEEIFLEGQASARLLERALSGLSDADVANSLLVLPRGVGLLPDAGNDALPVLRRLMFIRLEELLSDAALRAAPVGFAIEAARLLSTQA